MSVNKVILMGYVGSDPTVRYPDKDKPVASFSLATNDRYGASQQEVTEWHRLVAYGAIASTVEKYVRKGSHIYVEGRLRTRQYQDKLKITRNITEILVSEMELLGRVAVQDGI